MVTKENLVCAQFHSFTFFSRTSMRQKSRCTVPSVSFSSHRLPTVRAFHQTECDTGVKRGTFMWHDPLNASRLFHMGSNKRKQHSVPMPENTVLLNLMRLWYVGFQHGIFPGDFFLWHSVFILCLNFRTLPSGKRYQQVVSSIMAIAFTLKEFMVQKRWLTIVK